MSDEQPPEAPKAANWDLARVLYAQGLPTQQIALQCNVSLVALRKRITRGGWAAVRSQANGIARPTAVPVAPADDIVSQSAEARRLCALESLRGLRALGKIPLNQTLPAAKRHSSVLRELACAAGSTFGWDDSAPRIAVINLASLRSPRLVEESEAKPIDVAVEASPAPAPEPPVTAEQTGGS